MVQGTGAEWALCWIADLRNRLWRLGGDGPLESRAHLVFFLHDEVVVHTPAALADAVVEQAAGAAATAGSLMFRELAVDFPLTTSIVRSVRRRRQAGRSRRVLSRAAAPASGNGLGREPGGQGQAAPAAGCGWLVGARNISITRLGVLLHVVRASQPLGSDSRTTLCQALSDLLRQRARRSSRARSARRASRTCGAISPYRLDGRSGNRWCSIWWERLPVMHVHQPASRRCWPSRASGAGTTRRLVSPSIERFLLEGLDALGEVAAHDHRVAPQVADQVGGEVGGQRRSATTGPDSAGWTT